MNKGTLVRHKRDGTIGIVLCREITRKGNFRYWVFMDGAMRSWLSHKTSKSVSRWLEVIDE